MKWFKHDSNANMDAKLQDVLLDYGLEGYGLYWYCIELISSKVDKDNITFAIEHDARIIARNTGSTTQKINEMMNRFVDIGLFENADGVVTCLKLAKRLDLSMTSNPDMRSIISKVKNHDKPVKSHDLVMTESEIVMQDKIRLDKIRLNKHKRMVFAKPTQQELTWFEVEEKLNLSGFFDYYESNGWKVGKNTMKDWKAAARGWSKRQSTYNRGNSNKQDFSDDSTDWVNRDYGLL
jgi:hypothetical protein